MALAFPRSDSTIFGEYALHVRIRVVRDAGEAAFLLQANGEAAKNIFSQNSGGALHSSRNLSRVMGESTRTTKPSETGSSLSGYATCMRLVRMVRSASTPNFTSINALPTRASTSRWRCGRLNWLELALILVLTCSIHIKPASKY